VDSTKKLAMLRSLGADQVIDYTRENFTRLGVRYDLIFDVPGNHPFSACRRALTPEGRYVLIGHERFGGLGHRYFGLIPHFFKLMFLSLFVRELPRPGFSMPSKKDTMAVFRELLEAGKITPIIDSTYPLSEAPEALRHLMEGDAQGKILITP
jgi:NADPH:quinone reductase-like Zn-dependent oxidoreductase